MPIIKLSITDFPYEVGAILMATLAFPAAGQEERAEVHTALCNLALRAKAAVDEDWAWSLQAIKPGYLTMADADVDRIERKVRRRLEDRMVAAHIAAPFFQAALLEQPPALPAGIPRLSLNELTEYYLRHREQGEGHNIETRQFRPSKSVLHLAAAVAIAIDRAATHDDVELSVGDFLVNAELLRWIIEAAEQLEEALPRISQFTIDPATVVRIREA